MGLGPRAPWGPAGHGAPMRRLRPGVRAKRRWHRTAHGIFEGSRALLLWFRSYSMEAFFGLKRALLIDIFMVFMILIFWS